MKFAIVELASGIITEVGSDWEEMKSRVEGMTPSRWDNPVLVALPSNFPVKDIMEQEEGEVFGILGGGDDYVKLARKYRGVRGRSISASDQARLRSMHRKGDSKFAGQVVAVPESGWGYGARYVTVVNRNRKRLGLPSTFGLPSKELKVIEFRDKMTKLGPGKGIRLLSLSDTDLSEPEGREESFDQLSKLLESREKKQKEEEGEK